MSPREEALKKWIGPKSAQNRLLGPLGVHLFFKSSFRIRFFLRSGLGNIVNLMEQTKRLEYFADWVPGKRPLPTKLKNICTQRDTSSWCLHTRSSHSRTFIHHFRSSKSLPSLHLFVLADWWLEGGRKKRYHPLNVGGLSPNQPSTYSTYPIIFSLTRNFPPILHAIYTRKMFSYPNILQKTCD